MDFEKIESNILAEVRNELPRCFIIQKTQTGGYIVTIDTIGEQPTYDQLKDAINLLTPLSGRINGIEYEEVKIAFAEAYKATKATDSLLGAKERRKQYNRRFRG